MRIIAGFFKGRKLETPRDNRTRPTSDKIKEALFSILMNDIEGAVVCDLFAGTGNLGLESISRGAKKCYFIENSKESIKLIKKNIKKFEIENQSFVLLGDYMLGLGRIKEKIDIFFIDPPYGHKLEVQALERIREESLLAKDGKIVVEHEKTDQLPNEIEGFIKVKEKKYGRVVLSIYM